MQHLEVSGAVRHIYIYIYIYIYVIRRLKVNPVGPCVCISHLLILNHTGTTSHAAVHFSKHVTWLVFNKHA